MGVVSFRSTYHVGWGKGVGGRVGGWVCYFIYDIISKSKNDLRGKDFENQVVLFRFFM